MLKRVSPGLAAMLAVFAALPAQAQDSRHYFRENNAEARATLLLPLHGAARQQDRPSLALGVYAGGESCADATDLLRETCATARRGLELRFADLSSATLTLTGQRNVRIARFGAAEGDAEKANGNGAVWLLVGGLALAALVAGDSSGHEGCPDGTVEYRVGTEVYCLPEQPPTG